MKEKNIDDLIEKSLGNSLPQTEIDVRKETMARIEAYEGRKAKKELFIQWALSVFTAITSLVSVYVFEILFNRYPLFFQMLHINILIFQSFFFLIFLTTLIIMMLSLTSRKQLYNLNFV